MKKTLKKMVTLTMVTVVLVTAFSVNAFAASSYKDVTKKKVGNTAYTAITYLEKHQGYKNVISGNKFQPDKKITRREFLLVLRNLYGSKVVTVTNNDLKNMNKTVTAKYACDKMVAVAKNAGVKIKWEGSSKTILTRASASTYIKIFIDFSKDWLKVKK